MKICLACKDVVWGGLVSRLVREGGEIQQGIPGADLVITDDPGLADHSGAWRGGVRFEVGTGLEVLLDPDLLGVGQEEIQLTRIWAEGKFGPQTIIGFPLIGIWPEGFGAQLPASWYGRFSHKERAFGLFENLHLTSILETYKHKGFVTIGMNSEGRVLSLSTGVPPLGFFAIGEKVQGPLVDWLLRPTDLLESWIGATHMSRFPWPALRVARQAVLKIPSASIPHVHPIDLVGSSQFTSAGMILTSWATKLSEVSRYLRHTAMGIELPEKQVRLDLGRVQELVGLARSLDLV